MVVKTMMTKMSKPGSVLVDALGGGYPEHHLTKDDAGARL